MTDVKVVLRGFCAAILLFTTSTVQALPAGTAIVELLRDVCIPMAEGDEPDTSVLTRSNASGGAKGDLLMVWSTQSCRVIAPIDGASHSDQERLVKAIVQWAEGPVPDSVTGGTWDGDRPLYSVTHAEDSFGYLGFLARRGPREQIYFEFVWPEQDEDEGDN